MIHKNKATEKEFREAPLMLQIVLNDIDRESIRMFGKPIVITRIKDKIDGSSGVHRWYRASDFRDEYGDPRKRYFNDHEVSWLLAYVERKYPRTDGKATMIHHSFKGGALHFHVQIPYLMTDMRRQEEESGKEKEKHYTRGTEKITQICLKSSSTQKSS